MAKNGPDVFSDSITRLLFFGSRVVTAGGQSWSVQTFCTIQNISTLYSQTTMKSLQNDAPADIDNVGVRVQH